MVKRKFKVGDKVIYVPMGRYPGDPGEIAGTVAGIPKCGGSYLVLLVGASVPQTLSATSVFHPTMPRPKSKIVRRPEFIVPFLNSQGR